MQFTNNSEVVPAQFLAKHGNFRYTVKIFGNMKNAIWIGWGFGVIFFIIELITLPHYGINWDTINHLPRGQAYLHYFLTGNKNYSDLPPWKPYWQNPESLSINADIPGDQVTSRSFYQADIADYSGYIENDGGGHPPISDILSSGFNRVLFGNLKIVNDVDSYRIYSIFLASLLVFLVFHWVASVFGKVAGVVSSLSLATYPLFWSESHFNNEKDIPETVFWSFTIFCFWKGFTTKRILWIIIGGLFWGLGLGTKFNILFIPLVLLPWLLFYWWGTYNKKFGVRLLINDNKRLIIATLFAVLGGIVLFIGSWPYLWADPITRIESVFKFYKVIGLTNNVNSDFLGPLGTNTYALWWIITTTPLPILFLSALGIIFSLINIFKEKKKTSLLFLLWLAVPIARVTWSGTTIYGGVRQIMEYVPAMSIMAGIGTFGILKVIKKRNLAYALVLLVITISYTFSVFNLYKIHPNENVYFNVLVGGIKGAREKNIPFWGNSFGAAYRQGIVWINHNLPPEAKISYARELLPNIPMFWLRSDLKLHNSYRSGYLKQGEYVIGLVYQGVEKTSYFDRYLDRFLEPIYEVNVEGVSILKVWKNDVEHTKKEYLSEKQTNNFKVSAESGIITVDFASSFYLSRMEFSYIEVDSCKNIISAYVKISEDGKSWEKLPGTLPNEDWSVPQIGIQPRDGNVVIPFAADKLSFVKLFFSPSDSCFAKINNLKIYYFDKI